MAQLVEKLEAGISGLSRLQQAAFFATCGDRLLPMYADFSRKSGWGDAQYLSNVIDEVWCCLSVGSSMDAYVLRRIEEITPHGDDFDAPGSTFAQDAAICVDAAVRAVLPSETIDAGWVEFALEPARIAACIEQTGNIDMGSDADGTAWENQAVDHPFVKSEAEFLADTIEFLRRRNSLSDADILSLREAARKNRRDR